MAGKNMNYFLMDSTPNGRIKCTLANWTGVAYKIPRVKLVDCKSIDYLKQSGVYFLFSKGDGDKPLVYVGQSGARKNGEGILNRLKEHHASPKQGLEDWYEAIAFTGLGTVGLSAVGITSGLAAAGGGAIAAGGLGMVAGIFVLAAPIVILGAGGVGIAAAIKRKQLRQEKERLLKVAVEKHHAIVTALKDEVDVTKERADYLTSLNILLKQAIKDLQADLGPGVA